MPLRRGFGVHTGFFIHCFRTDRKSSIWGSVWALRTSPFGRVFRAARQPRLQNRPFPVGPKTMNWKPFLMLRNSASGLEIGLRTGFWPDSSRGNIRIGPPAVLRPAGGPILRLSRLESGRTESRSGSPISGPEALLHNIGQSIEDPPLLARRVPLHSAATESECPSTRRQRKASAPPLGGNATERHQV